MTGEGMREIIGYDQINVTGPGDLHDVFVDGQPIYAPEVTQDPWPEHYGTDRPTTVDEFVTALGVAKWRLLRAVMRAEKQDDVDFERTLDNIKAIADYADEIFCIADTLQDYLRQDKKAGHK